RYVPGENPVLSVMNFASWSQVVTIDVPVDDWGIHPDSTYYLNELLGGSSNQRTGAELASITTSLNAKQTRVYAISDSSFIVGIKTDPTEPVVGRYSLSQNYPNPFNAECRIHFELPMTSKVTLAVYNVMGQKVRTLVEGVIGQGQHTVTWEGRSDAGQLLSSGMYLYRIQAADYTQIRKMILLK
ncbi:T9SS type A sorting domain-containing protein, partial [bacterium]|nr:T9SS type A sorting domain-containing protein [bacterium]